MRLRFGLTQAQLSLLSGLSRSQIVKVERGRDLTVGTLRQILAGLGCELNILSASRFNAQELYLRARKLEEDNLLPSRGRGLM